MTYEAVISVLVVLVIATPIVAVFYATAVFLWDRPDTRFLFQGSGQPVDPNDDLSLARKRAHALETLGRINVEVVAEQGPRKAEPAPVALVIEDRPWMIPTLPGSDR